MKRNKYAVLIIIMLSFFAGSCTKTTNLTENSLPLIDYTQVCIAANKDKEVKVQGFLGVSDKVPCMNMLNPKRDCAFKFLKEVNIAGNEIIVYLQEGTGKSEAESPEAGKSAFESKPSSVFTRDQIKFRLDDGTLITPQPDVATPVTITGKVGLTEDEKICSITATKVEKR